MRRPEIAAGPDPNLDSKLISTSRLARRGFPQRYDQPEGIALRERELNRVAAD
jgi:hypothetical protein